MKISSLFLDIRYYLLNWVNLPSKIPIFSHTVVFDFWKLKLQKDWSRSPFISLLYPYLLYWLRINYSHYAFFSICALNDQKVAIFTNFLDLPTESVQGRLRTLQSTLTHPLLAWQFLFSIFPLFFCNFSLLSARYPLFCFSSTFLHSVCTILNSCLLQAILYFSSISSLSMNISTNLSHYNKALVPNFLLALSSPL